MLARGGLRQAAQPPLDMAVAAPTSAPFVVSPGLMSLKRVIAQIQSLWAAIAAIDGRISNVTCAPCQPLCFLAWRALILLLSTIAWLAGTAFKILMLS